MLAKRFISDRKGNFATTFALLATAGILVVGFGLDTTTAMWRKAEYGQSLDSAVLAAAASGDLSESARIKLAEDYMESNNEQECIEETVDFSISGAVVTGEYYCKHLSIFSGFYNPGYLTIRIKAVAEIPVAGKPLCVLALNPIEKRAIEASGGSDVNAPGCKVQVDSANAESVNFSGGATLLSDENCFVGGVKQGLERMVPQPTPACRPYGDPFAAMPQPAVGSCDYIDFNVNTDTTLWPGVYCGGIRASNATFTFKPGLYIIKDGIFESTGGATLLGDGVTFYLTSSTVETGITWSGGGTYRFSAMRSGPLAGFIVYLDPNALADDRSHVSGGGDIFYEGVFYFPNQLLTISGGGTVTTPSPFTAYVADKLLFSGGSQLNIGSDPDASSVPIPSGLYKDGTGGPRLVF